MEEPTKFNKPSELLDYLDSHGIYSANILNQCEFDTDSIPTFTSEQTLATMEARGLGGELDDTDDRLIYGYTTAQALASKFAGKTPGDMYHGRGSAFRANAQAVKESGN